MNDTRKVSKQEILQRRDYLATTDRQHYSQMITNRFLAIDSLKKAEVVFIYVDFRSEVQTKNLIKILLEQGKTVVVPVTLFQEKELLAVKISNIEDDLSPGYASILEPVEGIRGSQSIAPEAIDIIVLPGSVFDENGGRMGYGGGFYDRFVSKRAPQAIRIGFCFELQMVEKAPLKPHDEFMDMIVTEQRVISFSHSSGK